MLARSAPLSPRDGAPLTIVGIGASAGGLEALEQFFRNVNPDRGLAFVVVQHLDPTRKDAMVEILRRGSQLPVVQITDGAKVVGAHVFVIPPNVDLSIVHGVLHLLDPVAPRGLRLPIDFFFRSLAEDAHARSVGVILSGMGSDGALGARAIRDAGGAVFVQALSSAKFGGMPGSAIDAGLADVVAPVDELPAKIAQYVGHPRHPSGVESPLPDARTQSALATIIGLLRSATGHDFSLYKTGTMYRRVERRIAVHQIPDVAQYVRYLRENPKEAELLFKELLIGVTSFFRDPPAWERLKADALRPLLEASTDAGLRAWVPACSTGEEAYSLAMAFREAADALGSGRIARLQIFATDLDAAAVDRARQGAYGPSIAADVSPQRLRRFFVEERGGYRVRKEVRDLVVFATQNVLQDPPFTKLDLLLCRNLLIYLSPDLQQKIIPLFHYSLRPGGVLFLGSAETVGTFTELFRAVDGKSRLYRRRESAAGATVLLDFPSAFVRGPHRAPEAPAAEAKKRVVAVRDLQGLVERVLLNRLSPAASLTGAKGDVLYLGEGARRYLELPAGKANWNIFAMARDGLRYALGVAFQEALVAQRRAEASGVCEVGGESRTVVVTVEPIEDPVDLRGTVLILFGEPAPARAATGKRAREGHVPPQVARLAEQLRTMREEMQTSQEELRAANEELQSTNEELQSANEELTTSKEEMQSMNEELQTLNHELQAKVDELSRTGNDMKNLLDSTEIAILFLDDALHVRRFTPQAAKLIKLIPGDVGRPLADLVSDLDYPEIYDDAHEVLRTLVFHERSVETRAGRAFRVRIMPYRTIDNRIDGVVITFTSTPEATADSGRVVGARR